MRNKEEAFNMFVEMTEKSWTYEKLSKQERINLSTTFNEAKKYLKGNFKQRWSTLDLIYEAFLNALGYCESVVQWRE